MGYIYKITNLVNGKVYIGQTCRTISARWKEHLKSAFYENGTGYHKHLYKSIRKYGKDKFSISEVECCLNEVLNDRETFWINFYNSVDPNFGYNLTFGGEGTNTIDYDEVYKRYDAGESAAEIAINMGLSRSNLTQILKGYSNYDVNETWERAKIYNSQKKGTPICQYDIYGEFIAEFPSSVVASRLVPKASRTQIGSVCKNKKGLSGGFQWRFKTDPSPGKYLGPCNVEKTIYQFDASFNLINTFESARQAAANIGVCHSTITKYCKENKCQPTIGGYIWSYYKNLKEVF